MGKKDVFQSDYFENKKRFADAINGCLFQGKEIMNAEELEEADSVIKLPSFHQDSTNVICDKVRKWKGKYVSIVILENQIYVDYRMVLRVMKEEMAAYEKQQKQAFQKILDTEIKLSNDEFLSRMTKDTRLLPVITLVLYLGKERPWDGKTQLYDLLDMEEELKPYVSNYKFNLFDYHNCKDFSMFKTENQLLFELLANSDDKEKLKECLENSPYRYSSDPEVIKGILGSVGMKPDLLELENTEKGGQYDMLCKGLQDLFQDGKNEGILIGRNEGILIGRNEGILIGKNEGILIGKNEGTISTLFSLMNHNIISLTQAAEQASVTEERFMELVEQFHLKETQVS